MTETVRFQPGMILGRTFNIRDNSIGLDIFPELTKTTIECPSMTITCEVIESSVDVNNVLDISSDLSLKVKAGHLSMEGIGTYIKEERCEKTLEILLRAHVKTLTETLTNSQPQMGWKRSSATHYIRSIIYGGDLVARIYTKATDPKIVGVIKSKVNAAFQSDETIAFGSNTELRTNEHLSEMNISYYSTTLEGEMPTDLVGLLKALARFTSEVKKINEGKGSPLTCELVSLKQLDPDIPEISTKKDLMVPLRHLEDKYDDIKAAAKMLERCVERNGTSFTEEQTKTCRNIHQRIDCVQEHFNDFISNIDLTQEKTASKIKSALKVYNENIALISFLTEVKQFIKNVEASKTPKQDLRWTAFKTIIFAAVSTLLIFVFKK